MLKRELKVNFKSFMIWSIIMLLMLLLVFLVYPSIVSSGNIDEISEMMKMFPQEILIAFNMDISTLDSAFGWLKSEGFVFLILIMGCYAGMMGSNILLKEESDRTIEYLSSLPVKRRDIVLNKIISGVIYIIAMVILVLTFNYVGLSLSGEFDRIQFLLLSLTPLFSSLVIFFLCLLLSTFMHKTRNMLGISLGIVFVSYLLQMLSSLTDGVEFLKYFSVFTLADIRNVILNVSINPLMIVISAFLATLFGVFTILRYNKKDLV